MKQILSRLNQKLKTSVLYYKVRLLFTGAHKLSLVLGLIVAAVIFYFFNPFASAEVEDTTSSQAVSVERRNIVNAVKAVGRVTLADEQQMRFNVQGEIEKVNVREGDRVKRGDIIAELDKTEPMTDVRQAQLSVNDAALRLQDLEAGKNQQILSVKNSVKDLERQLDENNRDLPTTYQEVDNAIEQAKRTVNEKEAALLKAKKDMAVSAEDFLVDIDDLLDDLYGYVRGNELRGSTRIRQFEIEFLFNDQALKNETEWAYYRASDAYTAARSAVDAVPDKTNQRQMTNAIEKVLFAAEASQEFADISYKFIQTGVPSSTYTDADIIATKSSINGARSTAIALVNSINSQLASMASAKNSTAQQALDNAKESLAVLEEQKRNGITTATSLERSIAGIADNLEQKNAQLQQTETSVDVSIRQQQNTVAQRQVALQKVLRQLENYELVAPFDGVIRVIDFKVGDNLLADANQAKYVVIENPDLVIITVELDQVDIVHVNQGQNAQIYLDALPGQMLQGTVSFINSSPIETQGVVSYQVEIALQPTEANILSGMTATVEIITDSKQNVVAVPNLAISKQGQQSMVEGADGSMIRINTGVTDGRYTEVLSGVEEGQMIKSVLINVSGGAAAQSGGDDAVRNLMRATRGAGGGGGGGGFRPPNR